VLVDRVFNRARKAVMVVYVISFLLACLFVPWIGRMALSEGVEWQDFPMGYAPIWTPPEASRVDLETLFIELSLLTAVAALAFLLTGPRQKGDPQMAASGDPLEKTGVAEEALPDSFWGHFTLFSRESLKAAERQRRREVVERQGAEKDRRKAEEDLRRRREQEAARKALGTRYQKKLRETGETIFNLFVVSLTLFCIEIIWLLTNHVVNSSWGLLAFSLGFGTLFFVLAGFYGMTLYVCYCEIEKKFWNPIAALNLLLCVASWCLPESVARFSVTPTLPDLIVWSACTLFFSCGVFVRLTGK
jgi:hypothetical protein